MALLDIPVNTVSGGQLPDKLASVLERHTAVHQGGFKTPSLDNPARDASEFRRLKDWNPFFFGLTPFFYKLLALLERLPRPILALGGRSFSFYNILGYLGMIVGGMLAFLLTIERNLLPSTTAALLVLALAVSALHVLLTVLVTGRDSLVFLRYFLSIMATGAIFLRIIDKPIIPYLEILMLGLGTMQGFGRIGCFMVGCCHGRPARFGIRYQDRHARFGFPRQLVGVRLIPIQLIESIWIWFSVALGIAHVLMDFPAGTGLSWYLVFFSTGRFCFEWFRGDVLRPYRLGLSEAQWLSAGIVLFTAGFESAGVLPFQPWHLIMGGAVFLALVGIVIDRTGAHRIKLAHPQHLYEMARVFNTFELGKQIPQSSRKAIHIQKTSYHIQFSEDHTHLSDLEVHHCTLSRADEPLQPHEARQLSDLIWGWFPPLEKATLLQTKNKIYHLLRYRDVAS